MKLEFDIDYSYAKWVGKYTIGDVGIRGTRVWFRIPHTLSLDSNYGCGFSDAFDEAQESILSNDPIDNFNIHDESLEDIISILEGARSAAFFFEGNMKELKEFIDIKSKHSWSFNNLYLDKVLEDRHYDVLVGEPGDGSVLFFMYDKEGVICELKELLEKCNEHDVKWVWI